MESHIFYSKTRGKNLFQLPSHAKVHKAISFGAIFIRGDFNIGDTGFPVLTTC